MRAPVAIHAVYTVYHYCKYWAGYPKNKTALGDLWRTEIFDVCPFLPQKAIKTLYIFLWFVPNNSHLGRLCM